MWERKTEGRGGWKEGTKGRNEGLEGRRKGKERRKAGRVLKPGPNDAATVVVSLILFKDKTNKKDKILGSQRRQKTCTLKTTKQS